MSYCPRGGSGPGGNCHVCQQMTVGETVNEVYLGRWGDGRYSDRTEALDVLRFDGVEYDEDSQHGLRQLLVLVQQPTGAIRVAGDQLLHLR